VQYLLTIFLALAEHGYNEAAYSDHPIAQEDMSLPEGFTKLECFKDGTLRIRRDDQQAGLIKLPHQNKLFIEYTNRNGGMDISANGKYTLHCTDEKNQIITAFLFFIQEAHAIHQCSSKMLFRKTSSDTLDFKTYKPKKENDLLKKMPEEYKRRCEFDLSGDYLTCLNEKGHTAIWDIEKETFILQTKQELELISIHPENKKIIAQIILPRKKGKEAKSPIVTYAFGGEKPLMTIEDASDLITPRPIDSENTFFYRTNSEARQFNIDALSTKKIAEIPLEYDFKMPTLQTAGPFGLQYNPETNELTWKDLFSQTNLKTAKIPYSLNSFCLVGPHKMAWLERNKNNDQHKLHITNLNKLYGLKKEKLPSFEDTWKKLGFHYNTPEYLQLLNHPEWENLVLEKLKSEKKQDSLYNDHKIKSLLNKIGAKEYKTRVDSNAELENLIASLPLEDLKKIKLLANSEINNTQQKITWREALLPRIDHRIEFNLPSSFEIKIQRAQAFLKLQQPSHSKVYNFTALVDPKSQLPPGSKNYMAMPLPKK
jgi:hypothetical protein